MAGYLVLARKYRSVSFDDVVGQEPIARTLKNAIKKGRIAHAYLFTGTRGVGKTTMARILAKAMNCLSADAPTTSACNECNACVAIARGDDIDVIEIDGASNRGIDDVRELRSNAILRPARCRFKVYYIDEVHMLTKEAFNALLKTLEEPPAHVKFIFSTTEAEKLPATILSRCQRYDFRNIPTRLIAGHLKSICDAEKVDATDDALFRVARAAGGSMRDALSLLDQLMASGGGVTEQEVIHVLGTPSDERTVEIVRAIAEGSSAKALGALSAVLEGGVELARVVGAVGEVFRDMMVALTCGAESELIELPDQQRREVGELAGRFSVPALVQAVGVMEATTRNIRASSVSRALVEAALVRLAESEKFMDPAALIERLELLGATGPARPKQLAQQTRRPAPTRRGAEAAKAAPAPPAEQRPSPGDKADPPPPAAPAPPRPPLKALSPAEQSEVRKDPAVQAVTGLFDGDVVAIDSDIQIEAADIEEGQ